MDIFFEYICMQYVGILFFFFLNLEINSKNAFKKYVNSYELKEYTECVAIPFLVWKAYKKYLNNTATKLTLLKHYKFCLTNVLENVVTLCLTAVTSNRNTGF